LQEENKTELSTLLDDEALKGIPLMVLANKQDLVNAMAAGDVSTARLLFPLAVGTAADGSALRFSQAGENAAKDRFILSGGFGAGVGKPEGQEMADSGPKHAPCAGPISPARALAGDLAGVCPAPSHLGLPQSRRSTSVLPRCV
jgi:hypothetical protein